MRQDRNQKPEHRNQKRLFIWLLVTGYWLLCSITHADTIYYKDGTTEKGLVVEEYYDRYLLSTPDGEKEILKSKIDELFFDEPFQNNLYIGKRFEDEGDFESALKFYRLALQSKPDFKEAEDAIKGLEDAKWRFKKSWRYRELKEILWEQLGIIVKESKGKIVVDKVSDTTIISRNAAVSDTLDVGDAIISCWAKPFTYAGLKNASKQLIGLSNTILKLIIERDINVGGMPIFSLKSLTSPLIVIRMRFEGPVIEKINEQSEFYRSGLRPGDLIVAIDNKSTRYMKLNEIYKGIFSHSKKLIRVRREVTIMRRRLENHKLMNAMWAWHSKEVLLDEVKKKEFLNFCKEKNIGTLFFQLQYQFKKVSDTTVIREPTAVSDTFQTVCRLLYETRLRSFLKEAHSQGIIVYALDGSPEFCLEEKHHLVLAQINAILDFNKKGQSQERFDGVHYDNEPYLLPAFNSSLKEEILNQFLSLNHKCKNLIDSSGMKLEFGIDIPFWFDELNSLDRKLIDICDNVGIMDYRNFASGPDGIVAHALNELRYASGVRKKVFVGLETSKYPKQEVYFVSVLSEDEFNAKVSDTLHQSRFEGFTLRIHPYEDKRYIGLVKPEDTKEEDFKKALDKLAQVFGGIPKPEDKEGLEKFSFDTVYAISSNPEFRDVQTKEYISGDGRVFLIFITKEVMLEKLTFADLTEDDLNNTMVEAKKEFEKYSGFAGFAIHHYKSYRALCEKGKGESP